MNWIIKLTSINEDFDLFKLFGQLTKDEMRVIEYYMSYQIVDDIMIVKSPFDVINISINPKTFGEIIRNNS